MRLGKYNYLFDFVGCKSMPTIRFSSMAICVVSSGTMWFLFIKIAMALNIMKLIWGVYFEAILLIDMTAGVLM